MKLESLKDLYLEQLKDLYSAETQLLDALPEMADAASAPDLKKAFSEHLRQTQEHVRRLERIFETLGESPRGHAYEGHAYEGHACEGMKGLIREGEQMIRTDGQPAVLDAGLIAAAQRVEHYEIAGYGTVRTYAELLGYDDQVALLERTLDEEEQTDELLTRLAESHVNEEAFSS